MPLDGLQNKFQLVSVTDDNRLLLIYMFWTCHLPFFFHSSVYSRLAGQSCWWIIIPAACLCGCLSSNLIIASSRLVTGLANDSGPDWGLSIPFSAHPYPSTLPESTPHSWQVRRVFLYGPFHRLCHTLCLLRVPFRVLVLLPTGLCNLRHHQK